MTARGTVVTNLDIRGVTRACCTIQGPRTATAVPREPHGWRDFSDAARAPCRGVAMTPRSSSSTRRHSRATSRRKKSEFSGPLRKVVYIFEREGPQGGGIWWLVLECGHAVARKRTVSKSWTAVVHLMFEPIEKRFAPKSCQCNYCGTGNEKIDPAVMIKAFGGELP